MAVISIEVFARTVDGAAPLSANQQYGVYELFSFALVALKSATGPTLVLDSQVTPHETGAYISALCMAPTGTTASEAIADRIMAALTDVPDGQPWELHAGVTLVLISDN